MRAELKGIAASPGYALGRAWVLREAAVPQRQVRVSGQDKEEERMRLESSVREASRELQQVVLQLLRSKRSQEAEIFEGHLLLLEDDELIGRAAAKIEEEALTAESAMLEATEEVAAMIEALDDAYLLERAADIRDVGQRVIKKLLGEGGDSAMPEGEEPVVLIARDLAPSVTAGLDPKRVAGFVTAVGSETSHTSILARSLGLPAVVGTGEALLTIQSGQHVIVDALSGEVWIEPDEQLLAHYDDKKRQFVEQTKRLEAYLHRPTVTADGRKPELAANIGTVEEAVQARAAGAEGIGLFRTEFLFMNRDTLPSEDEQTEAYRAVMAAFPSGTSVIIRTLDIGGDKELLLLELPKEENPFLGVRAIRLCLQFPELFKTQLRAMLRASADGRLKIMFPMIATVQELRAAKALLEEAKNELRARGIPFRDPVEIGIMIEVPSAALMADRLAMEVDFLSIGTNDLVQYVMAADRMNPGVSELNQPLQPAVLRLIRHVIRSGREAGIHVGMCGEMAGNRYAVPILLGLGLQEFSMNAPGIVRVREQMSRLHAERLEAAANAVLELDSPDEIREYVEREILAAAETETI
ncbi:phosphoenolpyruvate--protein phosphotransferase [Paenibacillus filicis]|uniref:Phosphoenolpyruvate-protein phosphotransferase n=1 Tax=Paenibacillus gyeongsangnamensis TaxID=3388067 RepID=A0ABT4QGL9_9BACL|nr:phosphoenolpyruvate--protein phosphotransferase [Paenibacillus filicis]MCZ8516011.1 phosphoenolpyruvate--protein phosphotransferase [Paenibacillus filicis]